MLAALGITVGKPESGKPRTEAGFYIAESRYARQGCAEISPYADRLLRTNKEEPNNGNSTGKDQNSLKSL